MDEAVDGDERLSEEDLHTNSAEDAEHWLAVYSDLVQMEEWLLDDHLHDDNILQVRLARLVRLRRRQEFWRERWEGLTKISS